MKSQQLTRNKLRFCKNLTVYGKKMQKRSVVYKHIVQKRALSCTFDKAHFVCRKRSGYEKGKRAYSKTQKSEQAHKACSDLVRWKGFEPPTFWFVAKHSIQLSYQRVLQDSLPNQRILFYHIFAIKSNTFLQKYALCQAIGVAVDFLRASCYNGNVLITTLDLFYKQPRQRGLRPSAARKRRGTND